ncbi:hypothetical protein M501DRAFT_1047927 [Patellaria atrata CBS 101060]|uniref:RAD52 homolog n=1 Tax=Patellaria atrata CBS 101060 TaxID=1346257 RepID=A0A9P4SDL2_9PEZI|nr:hypothetical protein M501DRAFT_1047927 [Patellaria atrata CBS 101060]
MPSPEELRSMANSILNPFEARPTRMSEYTAQEIATLQSRLDKQLGPEYILTRKGPGNRDLPYISGNKAIEIANEVFGFNGWSSAVQNVQIDFVDESRSSGKISMGISVTVRITLKDGTYHEDIGYGHIENCANKAMAFEKCKKEAVTDGKKRALRNFGNVLGNCIYDKEFVKWISRVKPSATNMSEVNLLRPSLTAAQREAVIKSRQQEEDIKLETIPAVEIKPRDAEMDEFGGDFFDEVNFGVDSEFVPGIDDSGIDISEEPVDMKSNRPTGPPSGPPNRQAVPRIQSMPALNQQNEGDQPQRPGHHMPPRAPQTPNSNAHVKTENHQARMGPPQFNGQNQGRPQHPPQANHHHPALQNNNANQGQNRSNPVSAPGQHHPRNIPNVTKPGEKDSEQNPHTNAPPQTHEQPMGFVASRAADIINKAEEAKAPLPANLPTFNPNIESPSLRRTPGIDYKKSAPITKQALNSRLAQQSGAPNNLSNHPHSGAVPGPGPPMSRPNFVNPQADMNRRIGMPNAGMSPLANRTSYKPPGPAGVKRGPEAMAGGRPALSDVSNVNGGAGVNEPVGQDGKGDVKRVKVGENGSAGAGNGVRSQ